MAGKRGNPNLGNEYGIETRFKAGDKQGKSEAGKKGARVQSINRHRKEMIKLIATSQAPEKAIKQLEMLVDDTEDAVFTNDDLITAKLFEKATKGDNLAIKQWMEIAHEEEKEEEKAFELPARVIGKAFSDINREIVPNVSYVFKGGRGGLKSSYISLKIIEIMKNNPTIHACITRKVASTLKDSVFAQMNWAINELGLNDEVIVRKSPLEIEFKKTGQIIYFRGVDEPTKLKGIKPSFGYLGILWKEEKDQLSGAEEERSINQSVLRGNGTAFYDFSSYNPPKSKDNWVNKELLIPNENRVVHHSTWEDAYSPWLGEKFIQDALHLKEVNPDAYEHEYLGVPNGAGGNVFENLRIEKIPQEIIDQADTIYQGLDWGWYPDPLAFVRLYYDSDKEIIYFMDEVYENKWSNEKIAKYLIDKEYDDYDVCCDSSEPKSVNDIRDAGIRARGAIKGAGSIDYGIKWLQSRTLVIDPERTPNAVKEFSQYEYERDKEGNVISGYPDENNHLIDATRYALERFYNKRGTSA